MSTLLRRGVFIFTLTDAQKDAFRLALIDCSVKVEAGMVGEKWEATHSNTMGCIMSGIVEMAAADESDIWSKVQASLEKRGVSFLLGGVYEKWPTLKFGNVRPADRTSSNCPYRSASSER